MRISDWSSDVCSSDLHARAAIHRGISVVIGTSGLTAADYDALDAEARKAGVGVLAAGNFSLTAALVQHFALIAARHIGHFEVIDYAKRSEEHTSELQSLMRISYAVFCLKKKNHIN